MDLAQWHTQPYNFPEPKVERIKLNAPYHKASSALQTRLDEFVTYLSDRGFQPMDSLTDLCYRYRRIYGKYPQYLGPIEIFVRVASIDELQEQVGPGWSWDRVTVDSIGRDCLGHPAYTWAPYVTNHVLPKRDPSHNYGITDLNRIIYQTLTTVSSTYSCCGKELDHPGCWMGPTKYERVLYDVAPSFSNGRVWDLIVADDWAQVEALWRDEPPQKGTIWLHKEFYDDLHAKILEAKPRVTGEIVRVLKECREEKLAQDDPKRVPLNPWGKFDLDALYTLRQILDWQAAYNKIQCSGDSYDLFALNVGETLLNSEENHNVYRGVKLLKVSPANVGEAFNDAERVARKLGTQTLDQYIEGVNIIRQMELKDIMLLKEKIEELDGFLVNELNVKQIAQAIAYYQELNNIKEYGRDFRRAFNRNPSNPELSFQPELGRIKRIDADIRDIRSTIQTEELLKTADAILVAKSESYSENKLQGDDEQELLLKDYHRELPLEQDAQEFTPKLFSQFTKAKQELQSGMDRLFHLLRANYKTDKGLSEIRDAYGPLERDWETAKAILDPDQISIAKSLKTTTWDNADFTGASDELLEARELVQESELYHGLDVRRENFKRQVLAALVLGKTLPDDVYRQFALAVERHKAEKMSETMDWSDAKNISLPESGTLPNVRKIIDDALKSPDSTILAYAHGIKKTFIFLAILGDNARPSELDSLWKAAQELLEQMRKLSAIVASVTMVAKDIVLLNNQVKIDRSPVLSTSALVWNDNSCWIDATMTALFSIPETRLEEIMRKRQQIYVPESCDRPQAFYNAIMTDIAYLQSHEIRGSPQVCQSMQFYADCVKKPAALGKYNVHDLTIDNLSTAFHLGTYTSDYLGNTADYSATELLMKHHIEGQDHEVPDTLENGQFTLFSVIRDQGEHFVAGVREPTEPDVWWHIDKQTRRKTNKDEMVRSTPDKRERLVLAFYMRTLNWEQIAAKARNAHPLLLAIKMKDKTKVEAVLDQQPASILADLERLNLLALEDPNAWLLRAVRNKREGDVQVILDEYEDRFIVGIKEDLRKIGLYE